MKLQKMIDELADEQVRVKKLQAGADARTEKLARLAREIEETFDDADEPELTFEEKQELARFDRLVKLSKVSGDRFLDLRWRLERLKIAHDALEAVLELPRRWKRRPQQA